MKGTDFFLASLGREILKIASPAVTAIRAECIRDRGPWYNAAEFISDEIKNFKDEISGLRNTKDLIGPSAEKACRNYCAEVCEILSQIDRIDEIIEEALENKPPKLEKEQHAIRKFFKQLLRNHPPKASKPVRIVEHIIGLENHLESLHQKLENHQVSDASKRFDHSNVEITWPKN